MGETRLFLQNSLTQRERNIRNRFYWYDCGICTEPKKKHHLNFSWNASVMGEKFPAHLYLRVVVKSLKTSHNAMHGDTGFDTKRIRRERNAK